MKNISTFEGVFNQKSLYPLHNFLCKVIFSLNMKETKRREDMNIVANLSFEIAFFFSSSLRAGIYNFWYFVP